MSNILVQIKPILSDIEKIRHSYQNSGTTEAKISKEDAIDIAKKTIAIPNSYDIQAVLKPSTYNYFTENPVYDVRFIKEGNSQEEYVIEVDAVTGEIVFYYDQLVSFSKDKYVGTSINGKDLQGILMDVSEKSTFEGDKEIILPKGDRFLPEESEVWVISKRSGLFDFSKVVTLYINATEKKVYRYTKNWSPLQVENVQPKLNQEEIALKIQKQFKDKDIRVGSLAIAYSHYRKKPVLAYIVKINQNFYFINADTAKVEQIVNETHPSMYWIMQKTI